ncbi:MAG TPA: helix-turn-helix transcriptional regulator [Verrucomicrobiae bacterium]|nr:helix-turn-helix transcriptional regulator [Verrucomicrobiae bacterium]
MSQQKKLNIPERVRTFRTQAKLSQAELGERLSVSGNYIYLIESGRKPPGPTLLKLFESLEQSPFYNSEITALRNSGPAGRQTVPPNAMPSLFSTETLMQGFGEAAARLASAPAADRKFIIGQLRDMLDVLESRVLASSGPLSEAQQIAVRAASSRGGKRGA